MTQLLGSLGHVGSTSNTGMAAAAAGSWAAVTTSLPAPEQQQDSERSRYRPSRHCPPASALSSARAPERMPPSPRFPSWQAYS